MTPHLKGWLRASVYSWAPQDRNMVTVLGLSLTTLLVAPIKPDWLWATLPESAKMAGIISGCITRPKMTPMLKRSSNNRPQLMSKKYMNAEIFPSYNVGHALAWHKQPK